MSKPGDLLRLKAALRVVSSDMIDRDFVNGKVKDIRNLMADLNRLTSKRFEELSIDELYSMRYQIIALMEALVSLCSHIALEVYGYEPSSYKDCIAYVGERERIECVKDMRSLIGLRNILIHRYWTVDDRKVHESARKDFNCIKKFLEEIVKKYG